MRVAFNVFSLCLFNLIFSTRLPWNWIIIMHQVLLCFGQVILEGVHAMFVNDLLSQKDKQLAEYDGLLSTLKAADAEEVSQKVDDLREELADVKRSYSINCIEMDKVTRKANELEKHLSSAKSASASKVDEFQLEVKSEIDFNLEVKTSKKAKLPAKKCTTPKCLRKQIGSNCSDKSAVDVSAFCAITENPTEAGTAILKFSNQLK